MGTVATVNPSYYILPPEFGSNNTVFTGTAANSNVAANNTNTNNTFTNFEQLVALQNEETALNSQTSTSQSSTSSSDTSLLDGASLVTLSSQALNILNGVDTLSQEAAAAQNAQNTQNNAAATNTSAQTNTTTTDTNTNNTANASTGTASVTSTDTVTLSDTTPLTSAQLVQIAGVVSQFADQPLTATTVSQIQSALVSQGFNPAQVSLEDILISMNYIGLSPIETFDNQAINDATLTDDLIAA